MYIINNIWLTKSRLLVLCQNYHLFLSLSLSLLSLNFSPTTGVDAITKPSLGDLFAGQTDLGNFTSTPTKASLLYRCKSINNSFHNENDSCYTITNLKSN
ncbi:MAG: hypothetical protein LBS95_01465, partial [Mycoplasmataceae bacterium]|nr:hypothetical protein [Mycoplasmataceae bacterium]